MYMDILTYTSKSKAWTHALTLLTSNRSEASWQNSRKSFVRDLVSDNWNGALRPPASQRVQNFCFIVSVTCTFNHLGMCKEHPYGDGIAQDSSLPITTARATG